MRETKASKSERSRKGKAPVNTPASGIPAAGAGWGGPAKGNGNGKSIHAAFSPELQPENTTPNEDRLAMKIRRSIEMEDVIYKVAREAAHDTVKLQAAAKLHELYNGKPVERIITDEQPIERDVIDPARLSPEAREELRAALESTQGKTVN